MSKQDPLGTNYRKLWMASGISSLGDGVRTTVLPLFAVSITRDPVAVSLVAMAGGLPWLLFSLASGALIDRLDRRVAMWRVDAFRAAAMFALGMAVVADSASIPTLAAAAFAIGTGETLFQNASLAILPSLVRKEQLEEANSRLQGAEIVSREFVGPALGNFLFIVMVTLPFFLDAASFAVSAVLVFLLAGSFTVERTDGTPASSIRSEIAEGFRWLWHQRLLRMMAVLLGIWNLLQTACVAVLVLYALEIVRLPESMYWVIPVSFAVGSLGGSFLARRASARFGTGTTLICCLVAGAISATVLGLTSSPVVAGLAMMIDGVGGIVWNIVTISLRQAIIPDRLLGRVSGDFRFFGLGSLPFGALMGGFLAKAFGLRFPFLLMGGCLVVMTLAALPVLNNRTIQEARAQAATDSEAERGLT